MFLNLSRQSHTESSGNFLKKHILTPKHLKINQKSEIFIVSCGQPSQPQEFLNMVISRPFAL